MMDSHAGTHLVPPAYALPREGFDNASYSPEVQEWLAEYEKKYGRRGTSDVTTEKVPISQTCGPARVIDVRHLAGTTDRNELAGLARRSPRLTSGTMRSSMANCKPGDIVIFHSGWSDRYYRRCPRARPAWKTRSTARAKAGRPRDRTRSNIWRRRGSAVSPRMRRRWEASSRSGAA